MAEYGKGLYRALDVAVKALKAGRLKKLALAPDAARKRAAAAKKATRRRSVIVDHVGEAIVGELVAKTVALCTSYGPSSFTAGKTQTGPNTRRTGTSPFRSTASFFGAPDDSA